MLYFSFKASLYIRKQVAIPNHKQFSHISSLICLYLTVVETKKVKFAEN